MTEEETIMKKLLTFLLGITLSLSIIGCSTQAPLTTEEGLELSSVDEETIALQAVSSSMLLSYSSNPVSEISMPAESDILGEDEVDNIDYYVEMVEAFLGNDQLTVESQTSDLAEYDFMVVYTTYNLQQEAVEYKLYYNVFSLIDEEETTTEEVTTEEVVTEAPTTEVVTEEPTTEVVTEEPTTEVVTEAPTTEVVTEEPTTEVVTDAPTTEAVTDAPTTEVVTEEPTTEAVTEAPTTEVVTEAPTTEAVTEEPTTATELAFNDQRDPSEFNFRDEDDAYVVQGVEGLLIIGDVTYEIEGKVLEVEGRQILRLRSYIDENNLVLVNYQTDDREVDKEKFFFQVVEDGQVVSRSRVMLFENDQIQHVQLEFINGDDYERYQFHMRTEGDVTYIHIDYVIDTEALEDNGHIRLTKTVDSETGEATYSYTVASERGQGRDGGQFNKEHHGRQDDEHRPPQGTEV
jgi:hypothetical protein